MLRSVVFEISIYHRHFQGHCRLFGPERIDDNLFIIRSRYHKIQDADFISLYGILTKQENNIGSPCNF